MHRATQTLSRRCLRLRPRNVHARLSSSLSSILNPLPASYLRGGTSKGIFISRSHLPSSTSQWSPIFLGLMGSPDPEYGRQLNGMGGGVSSLSKICVVGGVSTEELKDKGVQAEYTFVQVGIKDDKLDLEGNCGNLTSVVGIWAVDQGMCVPKVVFEDGVDNDTSITTTPATRIGKGTVRIYNSNTKKIIDTTFPVQVTTTKSSNRSTSQRITPLLDLPQTSIAGVPGKASSIYLDFVNPSGARTGKLLPTGNPTDHLSIPIASSNSTEQTHDIPATLIDATNPTVFIHSRTLTSLNLPFQAYARSDATATRILTPVLESIRQAGAIKMGLNPSAQAQPKIAILSPYKNDSGAGSNSDPNIVVHALSMGVLHKAVPMTVGLCLGVAANVKNTIPWEIYQASVGRSGSTTGMVKILHPGGTVDVGAEFAPSQSQTGEGEQMECVSARVVRTGRRLMEGAVWW